ncbi:MAG: hypothetical protein FWG13_07565, partial [Leptospirales bacterium]|nr:hypothetical protein [Leptospirales bacterium]
MAFPVRVAASPRMFPQTDNCLEGCAVVGVMGGLYVVETCCASPLGGCLSSLQNLYSYIFNKTLIFIVIDTSKESVTEITAPSRLPRSNVRWGNGSMAVAGNKVVMGRGEGYAGDSILIVDPAKGKVTEKGGFSKARWGYESTIVAGNKIIMGPGKGYVGNLILIV